MYFESINESSYRPSSYTKKPISRNLFHQICGRAGRPGYDENGYIFILTSDLEQSIWIEDFYFRRSLDGKLHPRYDPINSAILSNYDLLEEIVLLKVFEGESSNMNGVIDFIRDSLLWEQNKEYGKPIEGYLNLYPLDFLTLLKTLGNREYFSEISCYSCSLNIAEYQENDHITIDLICNRTKEKVNKISEKDTLNSLYRDQYLLSINIDFKSNSIVNKTNTFKRETFSFQDFLWLYCLKSLKEKLILGINQPNNISFNFSIDLEKMLIIIYQIEIIFYHYYFPKSIIDDLIEKELILPDKINKTQYKCTLLGNIAIKSMCLLVWHQNWIEN